MVHTNISQLFHCEDHLKYFRVPLSRKFWFVLGLAWANFADHQWFSEKTWKSLVYTVKIRVTRLFLWNKKVKNLYISVKWLDLYYRPCKDYAKHIWMIWLNCYNFKIEENEPVNTVKAVTSSLYAFFKTFYFSECFQMYCHDDQRSIKLIWLLPSLLINREQCCAA